MIIYMTCYKIDNIIDVPANGDCMFESIWNSLDDQLREVITKEVYDIIQKQEDKEMGMNAYLEEGKEYRYLRILCHYNEHLYGEEFGVSNISNLRDKNAPDANKKIFDLNGQERWGDSSEIFIITSFLKKKKHNIHIQVYEKEKERDCYRLNDFDKIVDEKVDKEIYLIYVGGNHYKYTLSKPEKVDVVGDVDGDGAVIGKEGVGGVKTNVAPMIALSIFVLFMAAVSD
jgi:hypothetical protein